MDLSKINKILITCAPGLEDSVASELKELGYEILDQRRAGVEIQGNDFDVMELNLRLRCAYGVLVLLKAFNCLSAQDLYDNVREIEWNEIIPEDGYFSVISSVNTNVINNSMFANQKVKDAIVDKIQSIYHQRPDSGANKERAVVNFYWQNDQAWIYINTSGRKLSDRGYRKMPHTAPMQEALVAACIRKSGYDGTQPFIAPMCGSGTFAIEAALIATKRAAGLLRSNFGFMHLKQYNRDHWMEIRNEVADEKLKALPSRIIATDIDPVAINASKQNAKTAGVDHLIEFDVCDFEQTIIPEGQGFVMLNPEYGQRLGEIKELEGTYKRLGDFFKTNCQGYKGYIFTGNLQLAKKVGLRTSRKMPFMNAKIECRLLEYEMYQGSKKAKNKNEE